jgi:hypothetical protein
MAGGRVELVALTSRFAEVAVDRMDLDVARGEFCYQLRSFGVRNIRGVARWSVDRLDNAIMLLP